jgi:hypothetical protein
MVHRKVPPLARRAPQRQARHPTARTLARAAMGLLPARIPPVHPPTAQAHAPVPKGRRFAQVRERRALVPGRLARPASTLGGC